MYVAEVRNGFVPNVPREVFEKLKGLETWACPLANLPGKKCTQCALTRQGMKNCQRARDVNQSPRRLADWNSSNDFVLERVDRHDCIAVFQPDVNAVAVASDYVDLHQELGRVVQTVPSQWFSWRLRGEISDSSFFGEPLVHQRLSGVLCQAPETRHASCYLSAAVHPSPTRKPGARSVHRSEAKAEANVISFVESPKWT